MIFRLVLLNVVLFSGCFLFGIIHGQIASDELPFYNFPIKLYTITAFLSNAVYILGVVFETIYIRIWKLEMNFLAEEKKIFLGALVIASIVIVTAIAVFLISLLQENPSSPILVQ